MVSAGFGWVRVGSGGFVWVRVGSEPNRMGSVVGLDRSAGFGGSYF